MATKRLNPNNMNPSVLAGLSAYNEHFTALSLDKALNDARAEKRAADKAVTACKTRRESLLNDGLTLAEVDQKCPLEPALKRARRAKVAIDTKTKVHRDAMTDALEYVLPVPVETVYNAYLTDYDTKTGKALDTIIKAMLERLGVRRVDDTKAYNRFVAFIRDDIRAGKRATRIKAASDTVMKPFNQSEYINRFVCLFRDALVIAGMVSVSETGALARWNRNNITGTAEVLAKIAECRAIDKAAREALAA